MEEMKKHPRLSRHHEHPNHPQPLIGGISEEEFCTLLREESASFLSGEGHQGAFLHWLNGYICSQAIYQLSIPTVRYLHGWLILQLACTSTAREGYEKTPTCRLLITCLRQIYLHHSIDKFLDPLELQETILAHTRQIVRLVAEGIGDYEHECIIIPCLRSLYILFDTYLKSAESATADLMFPIEEFKDFLLALLDVHRRSKSNGSISVNFPAHQVLSRLATSANSENERATPIYYWSQIARRVVEDLGYEHVKNEGNLAITDIRHRCRSHREWLFHVESRISLLLPGCNYSPTENDLRAFEAGALDQDTSLSTRWSRCMAKLAQKHPFHKDLLQSMVGILLSTNNMEARIAFVSGLYKMNYGKSTKEVAECIVEKQESKTKLVISTLVDLILTASNTEGTQQLQHWRKDAAALLRDIMLATKMKSATSILDQDVVSICMVFLDSRIFEAVKCAVEILHHLFNYNDTFSGWNIDVLIRALAAPLICTFSDLKTKEKALDLYSILTDRDHSSLSYLARQPFALEALVKSASIGPLRANSISLLLSMANDPTNHRIMAKQTGLLSQLIRYVRELESMYDDRNQLDSTIHHASQDRETIKSNIMQIAAAL